MKIMIVSDTHGKNENLEQALEREQPIDRLIHLGDAAGCEDYIEVIAGCPLDIVYGNNDFGSRLNGEEVVEVEGIRIFVTHGHYYYVNFGTTDLVNAAKAKDCRVALYGHTHVPLIEHDKDVLVMNPGSLTYPRQEGKRPSYIVMHILPNHKMDYEIKFL